LHSREVSLWAIRGIVHCGKRFADHYLIHALPLRSTFHSSVMLSRDSRSSLANCPFGRQDRHNSDGITAVAALVEANPLSPKNATFSWE
jgi:hypothetical protein